MNESEQTPEYEISLAGNRKYIIIKYFVPMTTELALKSGPELMTLSNETGINRFLFDMRDSPNIQSVTRNYYFAYQNIQNFSFPKNSHSAFLTNPSDDSHDFITTAFMNAGYTVAKFSNEDNAVQWLGAEADI